jgi:hypothetical protein
MTQHKGVRLSGAVVAAVFLLLTMGCRHAFEAEPVVEGEGEVSILVAYHPGASLFPRRIASRLQDALAERGYVVTRTPSDPTYVVDQSRNSVLVVVAPVYGSTTPRVLREFLEANAPFSVPVFALLTGFFQAAGEKRDLPILDDTLGGYDEALSGGVKISTFSTRRRIDELIRSLCDQIDAALPGE